MSLFARTSKLNTNANSMLMTNSLCACIHITVGFPTDAHEQSLRGFISIIVETILHWRCNEHQNLRQGRGHGHSPGWGEARVPNENTCCLLPSLTTPTASSSQIVRQQVYNATF